MNKTVHRVFVHIGNQKYAADEVWEWRVILDFLGIKTSYPNTAFQPGSLTWTNHLSCRKWVSWNVWVVQTWLTVPAVSSISSMHCCPSTSTCCKRENNGKKRSGLISGQRVRQRPNVVHKQQWQKVELSTLLVLKTSSAQSKTIVSDRSTLLTFLYESSIVGSYFSTKIPCTNWTVWKRRCSAWRRQTDATCCQQRQSEPKPTVYIYIDLPLCSTELCWWRCGGCWVADWPAASETLSHQLMYAQLAEGGFSVRSPPTLVTNS